MKPTSLEFIHSPVTTTFWDPNILLRNLYSDILNPHKIFLFLWWLNLDLLLLFKTPCRLVFIGYVWKNLLPEYSGTTTKEIKIQQLYITALLTYIIHQNIKTD